MVEPHAPLGPYNPAARRITDESLHSGRLIQPWRGAWMLLACHHDDADARLVGHISDAVPFDALWTAVDSFTVLRRVTP